ncbi:uncharacterized protein LOC121711312 isoform X2 [Alosa sapidissima]|uniref:uncharacterized protein LOC121711312 isoform X2 n=1 Tax=Alosa sapidissima TaxID=34773 RepID=UPI001C09D15A|nr:uncharacterized protein LOC121711312 isoform X2 [Alosa sapidissima]
MMHLRKWCVCVCVCVMGIGQINRRNTLCEAHSRDTPAQRSEEMAKLHNPTVGLLLTVLLLLQGTRGDFISVFSSAGGAVTLPCNNVMILFPRCSSTTWTYNKNKVTVEEVKFGRVRPGITRRSERLSLLRNCSLHITNVTSEDAGLYTCQQYEKGNKSREDAQVYHSVIHITKKESGSEVTLDCHLHTYENFQSLVYNTNTLLSWVDEAGLDLQNTDDLQVRQKFPSYTTLTGKLRALSPTLTPRTWTCQLTAGGQVQTSATYTIDEPVKPARTTAVTRRPAPSPLSSAAAAAPPPEATTAAAPPPLPAGATTAPVCVCMFSVEIPIRLSIFFMVLIVPGLIGTVHLMRRRKQTSREASPAIELQVLN